MLRRKGNQGYEKIIVVGWSVDSQRRERREKV